MSLLFSRLFFPLRRRAHAEKKKGKRGEKKKRGGGGESPSPSLFSFGRFRQEKRGRGGH